MLLLSPADVAAVLKTDDMIAALADGFRAVSSGQAIVPGRTRMLSEAGALLTMPASIPGLPFGVKLVSVFEGNHGTHLPSHQAIVCLVDSADGRPLALLDGTHITAVRTAASAMLAIDQAVRPGARSAVVIGAGVQGEAHASMLLDRFDEVLVSSRNPDAAASLAAKLGRNVIVGADREAAVRCADVVCLCTHGGSPVIDGEWVRSGAVVTSVGFAPPGHELPLDLVDRAAAIIVEAWAAFEPSPVGCTELAGRDRSKGMELGEILLGRAAPRQSDDDVVVYKSMGHAIEDLVTAALVYRTAETQGLGQHLDW